MATTVSVSALNAVSLQQQTSPAPRAPRLIGHARRPEYMFIHTVRFWCILAIVLMHCGLAVRDLQPVELRELAVMVQPFKFGTIGFFLISGFLLGDRLPADKPFGYLKRRAYRLVPAWGFWYGLRTSFATVRDLLHAGSTSLTPHAVWTTVWAESGHCLTGTALWFVPNFFVALTCVVLCRRWLNDLRLGAIFLAANLFYSINVYTCWLPSRHTEAVFGFVFYLWLGAWCAFRKEKLQRWADSLSPARLLLCLALAVAGSLLEAHLIAFRQLVDPLNTLRFCNQAYSVLVVIALLRLKRRSWPRWVNVAETTYGIYLIHPIVIALAFSAVAPFVFGPGHLASSPVGTIATWAVLAPLTYVLSLAVTRRFASSPWPWMVGAVGAEAKVSAPVPGALPVAHSGFARQQAPTLPHIG